MARLSCSHLFDYACITQWMSANHPDCPLCFKKITQLTVDGEERPLPAITSVTPEEIQAAQQRLLTAATNGALDEVNALLTGGLITDEARSQALIHTIKREAAEGRLELIQALLPLDEPLWQGYLGPAVVAAAKSGLIDIVQVLLQHGPIDEEDRGLAIHEAALEMENSPEVHLEIVKELLKSGSMSEKDRNQELSRAVASLDLGRISPETCLELVKSLLGSGPITDEDRGSLVKSWTIRYNNKSSQEIRLELVRVLLASGPISKEDRGQALSTATLQKDTEIANVLINNGPILKHHHKWILNRAVLLPPTQSAEALVDALLEDNDAISCEALILSCLSGHFKLACKVANSILSSVPVLQTATVSLLAYTCHRLFTQFYPQETPS